MILTLAMLALAPGRPPACSVGELRGSPDYSYTVARIADFVDSAAVIVIARADSQTPDSAFIDGVGIPWPLVHFTTSTRLRGPDSLLEVWLPGWLEDHDDFNPQRVPYRLVRRDGQYGDCYARVYRLGAWYLLILQYENGTLSSTWQPLAPLNEQIRGPDDPWVTWVQERVRKRR